MDQNGGEEGLSSDAANGSDKPLVEDDEEWDKVRRVTCASMSCTLRKWMRYLHFL